MRSFSAGCRRRRVRRLKPSGLEGKSVVETAGRSGMSDSNVKISIHRALKALASFIGRNGDVPSRSRVDGWRCSGPILRSHLSVIL